MAEVSSTSNRNKDALGCLFSIFLMIFSWKGVSLITVPKNSLWIFIVYKRAHYINFILELVKIFLSNFLRGIKALVYVATIVKQGHLTKRQSIDQIPKMGMRDGCEKQASSCV